MDLNGTEKVDKLCRRAVRENNLTALQFLLQDCRYSNPIDLVNMSVKRCNFDLLDYLLVHYPTLECSAALACAVKQNNLTVIKRLLLNPISSVNYAVHLAYKYKFIEAMSVLIAYKEKHLSHLKETIPTFVIERMIKETLLKGDATMYNLLSHLVKDTDGLLLFLARNRLKEIFSEHVHSVGIRNHRHVSRRLLVHPDTYFARWAAYGF